MLRESIERIFSEYKIAQDQPFPSHPLHQLITREIPKHLSSVIDNPSRYIVKGSVGIGNWARCPWVSVFDVSITDSAKHGYYPVYLFREDMTGVYLSLNQGVTSVRKKYKADAKDALKAAAGDFRAKIGSLPSGFSEDEIDLRPSSSSNDSSFYEAGNICAQFYTATELPLEGQLLSALQRLLHTYKLLVDSDEREGEEDEEELPPSKGVEDLTKLRTHKRLERKAKLAKDAKKYHGYTCQACGFNFEKIYGSIGRNFIEAHHLKSLWTMKGTKVELDPRTDFAVLCPNCHRMIHRTEDPGDVPGFQKLIIRK